MKIFVRFKKVIWIVVSTVLLLSVIVFAENIHRKQRCKTVYVNIDGKTEKHLVTTREIKDLISKNGTDHLEGKLFEKIDFKRIEARVLSNKLVKSCQVHRDLSGGMSVDVIENFPIARVISSNGGSAFFTDNYVSEEGDFIGISPHYTARVLLLSGPYFDKKIQNLRDSKSRSLLTLIKAINNDDFWKAQLTQMIVEKDGGITLIPEAGNHKIEFGLAVDIEVKFKKLKIFYKDILPAKGWGSYRKVSVKYRNQVVCE